ncbi:hypothetical protein ACEWY4_018322 [Coilia grayii]|uniref:CCHC-type domain-containing protein n=1 Tax=Coilia grayii TaxID=363190 RepID=A0ABD1JJB7_9TELE
MEQATGSNNSTGTAAMQTSRPEASTVNAVMMPWFMGGPWIPKFSGKGGAAAFEEWRGQMEAFLRAQGLSGQQRVDFILSALEGEAKQEIQLVAPTDKDTDVEVFDVLKGLYGHTVSVAQLRAQFFQCRQGAEEGVGAFTLRLRELHHQWRAVDPGPAGGDDEMLRAQFAMGLRPCPTQQELQRQLRRRPDMTFADTCREAKALEKEMGPGDVQVCRALTSEPTPAAAPDSNWQQWRDSLKAELQRELRDQVTALGKTLSDDLRNLHRRSDPPVRERHNPTVTAPASRPRSSRGAQGESQLYRWDAQGRPICRDCGESGHIQRFCPRRQRPESSDF